MKQLFIGGLLFIGSMSLALASNTSAVDSHSCGQLKGSTDPFILVLKKGENISKSIICCADDANLSGATLIGLGALENTSLSYFDHKKKSYKIRFCWTNSMIASELIPSSAIILSKC